MRPRSDDAILKVVSTRRWGRIAMYFGLTVSGILTTFFPPSLVENQVPSFVLPAWSLAMGVSALGAFIGASLDRWLGEFTMIPLLSSSLALFGFASLADAGLDNVPLFAFGVVLLSFSFGLWARWRDILDIKRISLSQIRIEEKGE